MQIKTIKYHLTPMKILIKKTRDNITGKDVEKRVVIGINQYNFIK